MRTAITEPNAKPFAADPETCWDAKVEVASKPSQSPSEDRPRTAQRRRNARTCKAAFTALNPDKLLGEVAISVAWPGSTLPLPPCRCYRAAVTALLGNRAAPKLKNCLS